ncbi:MAG TPA: rRNA maturation RNase YbeY [Buchnera sp. (in: enterobacteria)]|nr:rRNA maturation RNase YbeY [Buchnera sp. (in: enterobacteria)]
MQNIILDIQVACSNSIYKPEKKDFKIWLKEILKNKQSTYEITIRIVEKKEIQKINLKYRGKKIPTNILSFPYTEKKRKKLKFLGDLIICSTVLQEEAKIQEKTLKSHWAHMIIHGTLHLLGYDHINKFQQKKMESLETNIMLALGYKNPYIF